MKRSALLLLPTLLGLACGEAEMSSSTADGTRAGSAALSAVFSGTVVDNQGQPIAGARVTVNGILRLTSSTGTYSVAVTESLAGYRFDIRKDGYAPVNVFTTGGAIARKHVLAKSFTKLIDPAINNEIADPASGIRVMLPANSLQTPTGALATGRVSFFIAPHGPDTMPGDFSARNSANQPVALETVGAVTLAAVDASGNTLSLIAGKTLDVRLPVPAAVGGGTMPACVLNGSCRAAMWRFDPRTGLWMEQAASPQFNTMGTSFRILGQRKGTIDSADGLGTWNADIETVNPACTLIKFENIPLDCYNPPPASTPEPGLEVAFEQMTVSGTPRSKEVTVSSSTSFIALVNLRASTHLKLSLEFPPGAPAYCAGNLSITSTPAPAAGFPAYWATGGITQFTTGALTYTGYPMNSAGNAITLADVVAGDHPCGSLVTFATHP
ncbi:carboxypeptidase regulatory-like domain-containing protein [Archangium violaceum]|uniref:carboxypeptidase-like regulatory domain-containing protein n=1 Tax=Archangium violaceum TaxID=83451 RepID=UPI00193BF39E|nr:carboxypeptidase-like regulatory domain-containing protein [Archangium violaceum]QRK12076.1 carboxypeptidase regulatory-like domain-containing protein [Archangium violaceum]